MSDGLSLLIFDEDDSYQMELISQSISKLVPDVFPDSINLPHDNNVQAKLSVSPIHKLNPQTLNKLISLIDDNLGSFYKKTNGRNWKLEKLEEMNESGLIYIIYSLNDEIISFLSIKLVSEFNDSRVLYLYEIHINPKLHSMKIGSLLMSKFHDFSTYLNSLADNPKFKLSQYFDNDATNLTVFSDNLRALNWYFKLGYDYTLDSLRDKVKNGKVIKPSTYMLTRENNQS